MTAVGLRRTRATEVAKCRFDYDGCRPDTLTAKINRLVEQGHICLVLENGLGISVALRHPVGRWQQLGYAATTPHIAIKRHYSYQRREKRHMARALDEFAVYHSSSASWICSRPDVVRHRVPIFSALLRFSLL